MFLHYFSGLTVKEIGESTDIPEKTIYKAIKTSIEKIKKEVAIYE
jgi:DNA-directed RNA polymerase specialized sigma24 family protein